MSTSGIVRFVSALALLSVSSFAQLRPVRVNPTINRIVAEISQDRIADTLKRLERFGTRHAMSAQDDPEHGIGAARRWIHDQFQSYSPRLEVSYDTFVAKKGIRLAHDVELVNVVAMLPGTTEKDEYVLVTGHYDSLVLARDPARSDQDTAIEEMRKGGASEAQIKGYLDTFDAREFKKAVDWKSTSAQDIAPGVTDDASGTAAVMELARVMSKYEFDKTIVFVAFACEECGLVGSRAYAKKAKQQNMAIEAVLNNDIIGSAVAGNGTSVKNLIRVFSDGPDDSASRSVARYVKQLGETYVPSMKVDLILRPDRFARGGDHTPFHTEGFGAVRFTTPNENFANQHSVTDTFANTSVPFTTRVAQVNAAAAASLALAPRPPVIYREVPAGPKKGQKASMISRGVSGYDAAIRWRPNTEPDLAGYSVVIRSTTTPFWQREIYVGRVTEYTIPNFSIDDVVIGVKAIDKDGNPSLVSTYLQPARSPEAGPEEPPKKE